MAYISFQPSDYFNTKLYTGNGSTQSITGVGFQPDWVWFKIRNTTGDHRVFDAVRGTEARLYTNGDQAEASPDTGTLTSFDSDGFSVGNSDVNINGSSQVAWNWKANGQGSANSDGSITTTYTSANTTSGVSIIKYTGNKTSGATIGHGLGAVPKMIIGKRLDTTASWGIYHSVLGATKYMAFDSSASSTSTAPWNDTEPTSSVITLGNWDNVNASGGTHVIYAFAEKTGFSKFGEYIGNGSTDGTFVYTGFKPAFLIVKRHSNTGTWLILDSKRDTFNTTNKGLIVNSTSAEATGYNFDFLSNGFKARTSGSGENGSGSNYLYMAFAEHPIVSSNDIPATAR